MTFGNKNILPFNYCSNKELNDIIAFLYILRNLIGRESINNTYIQYPNSVRVRILSADNEL